MPPPYEHQGRDQPQQGEDQQCADAGEDARANAGDHAHHQGGHQPDCDRQARQPRHRHHPADVHQHVLLMPAEQNAVSRHRRQHQRGRQRRERDGCQNDADEHRSKLGETGLKRQDQQEAGQNLNAGLRHPQLLQQLAPVAIQPLGRRLVALGRPLSRDGALVRNHGTTGYAWRIVPCSALPRAPPSATRVRRPARWKHASTLAT